MWRRRCSVALLAALPLLGQVDVAAMAGQFQAQFQGGTPTPEQVIRNLGSLSTGLRNGNWSNPAQRLQATQGALGYLNLLRGNHRFAGDRGIGLGMSGLYRQLGGLQFGGPYGGWMDPQGAWSSYRSSFLILNQLQSRFPQDQQIQNDLGISRRAVQVIEAKIPDLPKVDWASLDGAGQREFDEIMQKYISVSATVTSAEVTAESMRHAMADQGLAARPEVIAGLTRMKLKFEDAKRMIEQKRFTPAQERLDAVDAEAKKILKAFGG
jgi:hypothetical protein